MGHGGEGSSPSTLTTLTLLGAAALGGCAAPSGIAAEPRHRAAVADLERCIRYEMRDKGIDGLSIAVFEGGRVVWARGFGGATARSVFPVGSISKVFTAVAVMGAVERGELDLDAPVRTWLPDLAAGVGQVTLRQLLSHRSGLVREPARGGYFDRGGSSLEEAVASLDADDLVYEPGARFKYSNAGSAVAGLVLARRSGRPFDELIEVSITRPLELRDTVFDREVGIAPAVGLRSSAIDLAGFAGAWFGGAGRGSLLAPASWQTMVEGPGGVGLGLFVDELDGARRVGHDGEAYGHSAVVAALPDVDVAVAVLADAGGAVAVLDRIATQALRWMVAVRDGRELAQVPPPASLGADAARQLAGRYGDPDFWVDLSERDGELVADMTAGHRALVRRWGEQLVLDGRTSPHWPLEVHEDGIFLYGRLRLRLPDPEHEPVHEFWSELVGSYGTPPRLVVMQDNGRLCLAVEGFDTYPLSERGDGVFAFPDHGAFAGERVVFERDAVSVGAVRFDRAAVYSRKMVSDTVLR